MVQQWLFETERLGIRHWQPDRDTDSAFAIYGDREVMHFIREPDPDHRAVQKRLEEMTQKYQERNNGTGCWAIVEKTTQVVIGSILLVQLPDNQGQPKTMKLVGISDAIAGERVMQRKPRGKF